MFETRCQLKNQTFVQCSGKNFSPSFIKVQPNHQANQTKGGTLCNVKTSLSVYGTFAPFDYIIKIPFIIVNFLLSFIYQST